MDESDREIEEKYLLELMALKFNSKPLINSLTMMAEDVIHSAPVVVQTIETHLSRVRPENKLPILYLIDSIIKNVKRDYIGLFSQNIITVFCSVFEKVDEKTRSNLFKLRQTWNEVFPLKKLAIIDERCHIIDPHWPLSTSSSAPSNTIHVNPRFLQQHQQFPMSSIMSLPLEFDPASLGINTLPSSNQSLNEKQMREQLIIKQKQLLELQTKKLQLELLQLNSARLDELTYETSPSQTSQAEILPPPVPRNRYVDNMHVDNNQTKDPRIRAPQFETSHSHPPQNPRPPPPLSQFQNRVGTDLPSDPRVNRAYNNPRLAILPPPPSSQSQASSIEKMSRLKEETLRAKEEVETKTAELLRKREKERSKSREKEAFSSPSPKTSESSRSSPSKSSRVVEDVKNPCLEIFKPIKSTRSPGKEERRGSREKEKTPSSVEVIVEKEKESHSSHSHSHSKSKDKSSPSSHSSSSKNKEREIEVEIKRTGSSSSLSSSSASSSPKKEERKRKREREKEAHHQHHSSDKSGKEPKAEEMDVDQEDEMKGFCGLTIKPKRVPSPTEKPSDEICPPPPSSRPKPPSPEHHTNSFQPQHSSLSPLPEEQTPPPPPLGDKVKRDGRGSSGKSSRSDNKNRHEERRRKKERERIEEERENYKFRQSKVLSRNYRKRPSVIGGGGEEEEEESSGGKIKRGRGGGGGVGDIDLRFETPRDVDLRQSNSEESLGDLGGGGGERGKKQHKNSALIDNLFGCEDVDLRQAGVSSSWSQVKKPGTKGKENDSMATDDEVKEMLRNGKNRPPPPISPAVSSSSIDAFGRPLAFRRLPDDPDERRRSLGSRSTSVDPLEAFRFRYIDTPNKVNGRLEPNDLKIAFTRAKDELDAGVLSSAEHNKILKQLVQLNEAIKIREVEESRERDVRTPIDQSKNTVNPWTIDPTTNPGWTAPTIFPPPSGENWSGRGGGNQWDNGTSPAPVVPIVPPGPNPFTAALPAVPELVIPPANVRDLEMLQFDRDGSIPLDKVQRNVRFYGKTAIVFVGRLNDEPREISFQSDPNRRTVYVNKAFVKLRIGEVVTVFFGRRNHTVSIGAPTRELYIDNIGYEACFGGPTTRIRVDNFSAFVRMPGPPPTVEIGKTPRYDLVAGRTTLFVDCNPYNLYLDEKPQILDFCGFHVIVHFRDDFRVVTFNGFPIQTQFGGNPRPITIPGGRRFYIRFNSLSPATELLMSNKMRNRRPIHHDPHNVTTAFQEPVEQFQNFVPTPPHPMLKQSEVDLNTSFTENPLDMVANLLPSSQNESKAHENSYEVETPKEESTKEPTSSNALSVHDLLSKLMLAGLLPSGGVPKKEEEKKEEDVKSVPVVEERAGENKEAEKPMIAPPLEEIKVTFDDNLKLRRQNVIDSIYVGVQCGSCGLRFPPDQNFMYTQHLDWHFRQNRREKGNTKKALSRKWYYDLSDWIQFQEVEDLESRAASMFELQIGESEEDKIANQKVLDPDAYTVLSAGYEGNLTSCPQCGEGFETFYDEEKEEWRLRDAFEDPEVDADGKHKLFHPVCHQDYLTSLVEEEDPIDKGTQEDDDDEVQILKEGKKEVVLMELDIADDDVIEEINPDSNLVKLSESETNLVVDSKKDESLNIVNPPPSSHLSYTVIEPIVIDVVEDDDNSNSNIPGISSSTDATTPASSNNIFGIALNSSLIAPTTPTFNNNNTVVVETKKIVYEPWQFDFPKIKQEPIEWQDLDESLFKTPFVSQNSSHVDPVAITLDEEDEVEPDSHPEKGESSSGSKSITEFDLTNDEEEVETHSTHGAIAEIDGNLHFKARDPVVHAPTKIKINIAGFDFSSSQSPTHKGSGAEEEDVKNMSENSQNSPNSSSDTLASSGTLEENEEMKRLKPRLIGKKLVNCPKKSTGKEESGLCTIS